MPGAHWLVGSRSRLIFAENLLRYRRIVAEVLIQLLRDEIAPFKL
ncbi:hypothetical protein [Nitrosococcus wardiae]|nr:hypothetical protein [Nitrosococcus wardiae]